MLCRVFCISAFTCFLHCSSPLHRSLKLLRKAQTIGTFAVATGTPPLSGFEPITFNDITKLSRSNRQNVLFYKTKSYFIITDLDMLMLSLNIANGVMTFYRNNLPLSHNLPVINKKGTSTAANVLL